MGPQSAEQPDLDQRREEILLAQVRLLYANTYIGICITLIAAGILGYLEWNSVSHSVVVGWWVYIALASAVRYAVARAFHRASPGWTEARRWAALFAICAGLAGVGWGSAGILLYPERSLTNQVFLVFIWPPVRLSTLLHGYPRGADSPASRSLRPDVPPLPRRPARGATLAPGRERRRPDGRLRPGNRSAAATVHPRRHLPRLAVACGRQLFASRDDRVAWSRTAGRRAGRSRSSNSDTPGFP